VAPSLFRQLFVIHGLWLEQAFPLVYALLPDKRKVTNTRMLTALVNFIPEA
jgi:hypothetical protein